MRHDTAVMIGSGGMGEVYKAWDPDIERWVAFKYLKHSNPEMVERLLREARAQARVEHPGVCKVYEVGWDDGHPFIAMQHVDGLPLNQAVANMALEEKVLVVKRAAEAVQAAHAVGLIHRDLKPGNIIVARGDDGRPLPYVLDFGIAREVDVSGLTMTGQILGTPGYLSPEQAMGATVDRRTDVFSLGVVLYEVLSSARPFTGGSEVAMLLSLLGNDPVPLRRRVPSIPRDLETVVATCLEKEPARRYPSARALAEDLGRFLDGEPVLARRRSPLSRLVARARHHPRLTAAALVAVLAIAGFAGLAVQARLSAARRVQAAQRFGQEVERIESVLGRAFLLPLHDIRPQIQQVRERIAWIDAEMERLGGVSRGVGHDAAGRGYLALGDVESARRRLQLAWDLGERTPRVAFALGLSLAQLYRVALEDAAAIRNPALREEHLERARRQLRNPARTYLEQSVGGAEHPKLLAAWLAFASDDSTSALEHLRSLHDTDPFFYPGDLLAGAVHRRVYQEAVDHGDTAAADAAFAAARSAFSAAAAVGESDPRPAEELCALWVQALRVQYFSGGELEPARDAALEACGRALTANPDSAAAHLEVGRARRYWAAHEMDTGQDPTAELERARDHARRALAADPDNHEALILLGVCSRIAANALAETGGDPRPELRAAVTAYTAAIRIEPANYGANTSLATAHLHLGADARARGEDPTPHFRQAADAARRATELHPELVGAWINLGIAEGQIGLWRRDTGGAAEPCFARGGEALRRAIQVNPEFYTAHYNLGEMLVEQAVGELRRGRDPAPTLDEAEPLLEIARERFGSFAAPNFLLAHAAALRAEHARLTGGDPGPQLERAAAATHAGRAIRSDDPTGLLLASLAPLVEARWRLAEGRDPSPAIAAGLELVNGALAVNPSLAAAWARAAELELVVARRLQEAGRPADAVFERAEQSTDRARGLNSGDAGVETVAARLWRQRAESLFSLGGDPAAALAHGLEATARALALDPARARAHIERAALEALSARANDSAAADHTAAAASAWSEAKRLNPLLEHDRPAGLDTAARELDDG